MIFTAPGWFGAAGVAAMGIVALHVLRPRRETETVSSTYLWSAHHVPLAAASPWQRLRITPPFIVQLLLVAALGAALANPVSRTRTALVGHTVFLIDSTASMGSLDGSPDRVASAVTRAAELRRTLPPGGRASIVSVEHTPRVVLTSNDSVREFDNALKSIKPTSGGGDFVGAFALAEGLETTDGGIGFVLLSDGRLTDAERRLLPLSTRYEPIGKRANNRGIVRITNEARGGGLHTRLTIKSFGGPDVRQTVRIDADGRTVVRREIAIKSKSTVDVEADIPSAERIEAFLDPPAQGDADLFEADDHVYSVSTQRRRLRVLHVGAPNRFIGAALESIPSVTVEESPTARSGAGYDLAIYDGVAVPADPGAPVLAIAPPGGLRAKPSEEVTGTGALDFAAPDSDVVVSDVSTVPASGASGTSDTFGAGTTAADGTVDQNGMVGQGGVSVLGSLAEPSITFVKTGDDLLSGLDLSDVVIAEAQALDEDALSAQGGEVLVGADRSPLLVRTRTDRWPAIYLAFQLAESNLALQVAFPILMDRIVNQLGGAAAPPSSFVVGDSFDPLTTSSGLSKNASKFTIRDPTGRIANVDANGVELTSLGFWKVTAQIGQGSSASEQVLLLPVNPPPDESDIRVEATLPVEKKTGIAPRNGFAERSLRPWFLIGLIALFGVEFLFVRRRVGVSRRQWGAARLFRGLSASLILAALVAPVVRLPSSRVATVFAIDASDSLGQRGRREALDAVADALKHAPKGAASGVVIFGGNARVLATVRNRLELAGATVVVDGTRTDLAAGLRLAGAVVPGDAKRRVVLLSDGRRTTGNEIDVARSLRDAGVRVDVIPVGSSVGADAALAGIEAPSRARVGENVVIRARVVSSVNQTVRVALKNREGSELATKEVGLSAAEERVVEFSTVIAGAGVARYGVEVTGTADSVLANDAGSVAIEILGAAKVLVVEGTTGAASSVSQSLRANGIAFDTVDPGKLGDAYFYTEYNSVVLADVDVRSIARDQISALTTAVRELGKGLVVVGGTNSYGPGGYLGSDLEELLPVVSEVQDPLRRKTVAEVMAIDSSGSMAACHCGDASNRNRVDGGIIKTDIARAGAQQAIESLQPSDEVGVVSIDDNTTWVIDLGLVPSGEVARKKLNSVKPGGSTNLGGALRASADKLRLSKAALKHIVLFTDGFTPAGVIDNLALDAAALRSEGITVSVVATGEGAFDTLKQVAVNGGGRFYPGRDLREVPRILVEESQIAARSLINEGRFLPTVTSSSAVVRGLRVAPELLGYIATTAKPTARTLLRVGEDNDPLLTTWQAGIGKVSAWTSDGSGRWTSEWAAWERNRDFWTGVVKDTFPVTIAGGAIATIRDDQLSLRVTGANDWPDGATAIAQVRAPDGSLREVRLDRVSGDSFSAAVPVDQAGSYTAGIRVESSGDRLLTTSALVNKSYSPEYAIGKTDTKRLLRISAANGGRGVITPSAVYDGKGLVAGSRRISIAWPLLLAAALTFLASVALWRLRFRPRGSQSVAAVVAPKSTLPTVRLGRGSGTRQTVNADPPRVNEVETLQSRDPADAQFSRDAVTKNSADRPKNPPIATPTSPPEEGTSAPPSVDSGDSVGSTVNRLLDRKRRNRS